MTLKHPLWGRKLSDGVHTKMCLPFYFLYVIKGNVHLANADFDEKNGLLLRDQAA